MAEHSFNEISRKIVDEYLRDIVFIDEEAFGTVSSPNSFDAKLVSQCFADAGKFCAIYAPVYDTDIKHCVMLASKADALIVDWRLVLKRTKPADPNADANDDIRGEYTLELLHLILDEARDDKFKMIVIYTGEDNFGVVYDNLCAGLKTYSLTTHKEKFSLSSKNIEIIVRSKRQYPHNREWNNFVLTYQDLPAMIIDFFTEKIKGILPNFALKSITEIRNSTSKILGVFSKNLDPALLGHYVSIPDCNDTFPVLSKAFGTAVTNLIDISGFEYESWIEKWIEENKEEREITIENNKIKLNVDNLKNLVESSGNFETKFNDSFGITRVNQYNVDLYKRKATDLFCTQDSDLSNYKWSRLLQYNNLFSSSKVHKLTLGTIVKCKGKDDADWKYLLCIQQRCDSVRIQSQEVRTFLFLPLVKGIKGEAVVVGENDHYIVDNKTYSIELHEFSPSANDAHIAARQIENNEYIFQDKNGIKYIWVAELNEMFAQSIASAYASQLSRVGIDNSEWLRLVGKIIKK